MQLWRNLKTFAFIGSVTLDQKRQLSKKNSLAVACYSFAEVEKNEVQQLHIYLGKESKNASIIANSLIFLWLATTDATIKKRFVNSVHTHEVVATTSF